MSCSSSRFSGTFDMNRITVKGRVIIWAKFTERHTNYVEREGPGPELLGGLVGASKGV